MSLLNPWGLAWLALIVPVILLYLLRLRRREVTVSSVLFWSRAIDDLQANAPFQKLRRNLLLLLQILVIIAASVTIARPQRLTNALGGSVVAVVLDSSASMQAAEGGSTRFELAKAKVREMLGAMERSDRMMLVLATDRAELLHPLSSDVGSLSAALAGAQPTDRSTRLADALFLAVSATRTAEDAKVFLISDGATPPLDSIGLPTANVELVRIGQPADNVGLVALDARRTFGQPGKLQLLLALEASGPTEGARQVELELRSDGRLFDVRGLSVTPGKPTIEVLENLPTETGLLEARLTTKDALAADDVAYVQLGQAARSEVLLVGTANLFIEKALSVDPGRTVVKLTGQAFAQIVTENRLRPGSVAIFYGAAPQGEVPLPALFINCAGPTAPVDAASEVEFPPVLDYQRQHPILQSTVLDAVAISKAAKATVKPWAVPLVESKDTPLLAAGEQHGLRRAWIGFDLLDSDLPLQPAFPILVGNLLRWLTAGELAGAAPAVWIGEPVSLNLGIEAASASISDPAGEVTTTPLSDGRLQYAGADRVGLYQVSAGGVRQPFAVSLLDADESDLTPRSTLQVGRTRVVAPSGASLRHQELWRWVAGLVLGLLMVEWWWYHRRG